MIEDTAMKELQEAEKASNILFHKLNATSFYWNSYAPEDDLTNPFVIRSKEFKHGLAIKRSTPIILWEEILEAIPDILAD